MKNTLPQLRSDKGLSQEALAEAVGVSRQTIISIEKGRFDPSLPLAFRLAELFDCTIEDIFTPEAQATNQSASA
ncbi:putative transcriptional regulator [Bifidobacterium bohemicum]|uniref:Helix-turn-helix repressor protein n=1 Tax=Bifidobacterium bohemicum DSM 22767 TaxID=1437606 RepID=A0A086ZJL1_9BIFI|nr:helix-turn-helix transcriptional regulator [Bifidobacterium bohemicum]KFI46711.1 Helix-turn-helix repressor protein [Bifidobacterium bohemicum DSM 22767]SCB79517.1 putative transcriptional regulator [Bifidobacterium bohemicum]